MQSIHVPGSVVARVLRILGWLMPPTSVLISALALGYRWVGGRASVKFVATAVAPAQLAAKEAQALGHHCSSVLLEHDKQLSAAWAQLVALHAELEVYRRYSTKDPVRRGELIEDGTRFFRAEFDRQLEQHPHDPAEAARRALLARWRPESRP